MYFLRLYRSTLSLPTRNFIYNTHTLFVTHNPYLLSPSSSHPLTISYLLSLSHFLSLPLSLSLCPPIPTHSQYLSISLPISLASLTLRQAHSLTHSLLIYLSLTITRSAHSLSLRQAQIHTYNSKSLIISLSHFRQAVAAGEAQAAAAARTQRQHGNEVRTRLVVLTATTPSLLHVLTICLHFELFIVFVIVLSIIEFY